MSIADTNDFDADEEVGTIVGVGIGNVQDTEYLHRDETGRIDRRFGFHELLHEQGDQWGTIKPYMDLCFLEATCRVTADRGSGIHRMQLWLSYPRQSRGFTCWTIIIIDTRPKFPYTPSLKRRIPI